jgi:BirA family transcriptional regulator, biotin operon repressor / biotin---[acetyl-CoA-carboxylase] ligase
VMNTKLVDKLAIDRIRRHLATDVVGRHLYLFDAIGSTNTALRDLALAGAAPGTVVMAEMQNAGRARMGTAWFSPPGLNLYVSVLLRPAIPLTKVPVFSFITSLALTDAAWAAGLSAWIKWPNDIVVDGRKVAGCLADVQARANQVDHVILGAGINLNVRAADIDEAPGVPAGTPAEGMASLAGRAIDRNVFTASLLNHLERWLTTYREDGPAGILTAWRSRDALAGHEVCVYGEGLPYRGRAAGVDDAGFLQVETPDGRRRVISGHVTFAGDVATA